jgi:hypothetical protein
LPVFAILLVAGGCTTTTHGDGTTFCGTHFPTGAEGMTFDPLARAIAPPPGAPPTASVLPPQESGDADYGTAFFIRTSPDCAHGAVVEVLPANDTTSVTTVSAGDGGIAGIVIWPTAQLTVYAWSAGDYQGGLVIRPK